MRPNWGFMLATLASIGIGAAAVAVYFVLSSGSARADCGAFNCNELDRCFPVLSTCAGGLPTSSDRQTIYDLEFNSCVFRVLREHKDVEECRVKLDKVKPRGEK